MPNSNTLQWIKQELKEFAVEEVSAANSFEQLKAALSNYLNQLIVHDFNSLVALLYRLDISEKKLQELLALPHQTAGEVMADLVIKRQLEKIESRNKFKHPDDSIPDDERW